jgi:hypothetical protein
MTVLIYLPKGEIQAYSNASSLEMKNGLTTFFYQPDAGRRQEPQTMKITTTLPIFVEEEVGQPRVRTL